MLIDLSHTLSPKTPVWPGDISIALVPSGNPEAQVLNHQLTMSMHGGTHMDGPAHMVATGKSLYEFHVEKFRGRGKLIDCRGKKTIDADALAAAALQKDDVVLFYTGMSEKFEDPTYFTDYPVLTPACAHALVQAQVKYIGLDFCSPDSEPFEVHRILLAREILIIENLTGLKELMGKSFEVMALPLKIAADSAPVRVVAMV